MGGIRPKPVTYFRQAVLVGLSKKDKKYKLDELIKKIPFNDLIGWDLQGFDVRLYDKSKRGLEIDKYASEFLQKILMQKQNKDNQNAVNKQLKRVIPILNNIRKELESNIFGIP